MDVQELKLELRLVNSANFNKVLLVAVGLILLYMALTLQYFGVDYFSVSDGPGTNMGKTSADSRLMVSLWLFLLMPVLFIPMLYIARRVHIIVNESGIFFKGGLKNGLQSFLPDWSVQWDELQEASWQVIPGNYIASRLWLHAKGKKHRISPWHWVESGVEIDRYIPPKKCTVEQASLILKSTPLVEWVSRKFSDYRHGSFYEIKKPEFALGIDGDDVTPVTATIAIIFVVLVCLFIAEIYFTANEFYADSIPYSLLCISALLGFLVAHLSLKHIEPERTNSAVYALLFGLGVGFAAYPFLLRVNAWTDSADLQPYDYHLDSDYVWRAEEPDTPELHLYLSSSSWWQQFQPGDSYSFELRKGGLDFWQVNMSPIYDSQKGFTK